MAGRLIVISNRIPTVDPSGGLVVALHDALLARGGVWVGADPDPSEEGRECLHELGDVPYRKRAFRLSKTERQNYYSGFANSVLWPICHRRTDLIEMKSEYRADYLAVNLRLARLIAQDLAPQDVVWVHDYHFLPLAMMLRSLGVTNRIGFFLHIPFPNITDLAILPRPEDFARWLASYNLLGLQTRGDVARALEMFRADPRAEFLRDGTVKFDEHIVTVASFPIGIDCDQIEATARSADPGPFGAANPRELIIGADRLDYTKGLPHKFEAFGRLLQGRVDRDARPTLLQIASPSRADVAAYRQITNDLQAISGRINGQYSELDWQPLRFVHRSVARDRLIGLMRRAEVGLVTPLADGMNLVAKEFVAAQAPDNPGVLVLSRFAGAAEDMKGALLINPHDLDETAGAIDYALAMPLDERRKRHADCLAVVRDSRISVWTDRYLARLASCVPTLALSRHQAASA
ncbi:trehalose-6-phosphate synthase [Thioclava sp. GXIMD4215]|uniref:alpha,alpha-trehalose-phosphate synthase (UDP-forming) n=1 Tax=Thioclava sp. GXIMD4215 TaxID=3131928 RepID=UPI00311B3903